MLYLLPEWLTRWGEDSQALFAVLHYNICVMSLTELHIKPRTLSCYSNMDCPWLFLPTLHSMLRKSGSYCRAVDALCWDFTCIVVVNVEALYTSGEIKMNINNFCSLAVGLPYSSQDAAFMIHSDWSFISFWSWWEFCPCMTILSR